MTRLDRYAVARSYDLHRSRAKLSQIEAEIKELKNREAIKFDPDGIDYDRYIELQDQRNALLERP